VTTHQLYTSIPRSALEDVLNSDLGDGARTLQDLIDSPLKKERTLGRRLFGLALLNEQKPGMVADLLARDDWACLNFYREPDGKLLCEVVRSQAQAEQIAMQQERERAGRDAEVAAAMLFWAEKMREAREREGQL